MQSQYVVLKSQSGNLEAVKLGFSWITLIRVWVLAGIIFFILDANSGGRRPEWIIIFLFQDVIGIPIGILLGQRWNKWLHRRLTKTGYVQVNAITAANPEGAVALHIKQTQN